MKLLHTVVLALAVAAPAFAQDNLGSSPGNPATKFKDPSVLVPPAGQKVAILEWEDLECPFCARAFPSVHVEAKKAGIPIVERDYLIPGHVWSPQAALTARYIHDKISSDLAVEFRRELFASQFRIASRDDLQRFVDTFAKANGKTIPAQLDPTGALQKEIDADVALGDKLGVVHTPTIVVAGPHHWTEVLDMEELPKAIAAEKARAGVH